MCELVLDLSFTKERKVLVCVGVFVCVRTLRCGLGQASGTEALM